MLNPGKVGAPWPADPGPLIGVKVMLVLSNSNILIQGCALPLLFYEAVRLFLLSQYNSNPMLIFLFFLPFFIIIINYNNIIMATLGRIIIHQDKWQYKIYKSKLTIGMLGTNKRETRDKVTHEPKCTKSTRGTTFSPLDFAGCRGLSLKSVAVDIRFAVLFPN